MLAAGAREETSVDPVQEIAEKGYTILSDVFDADRATALVADLERLERELGTVPAGNSFEGARTLRVYNLLAHGALWQELAVDADGPARRRGRARPRLPDVAPCPRSASSPTRPPSPSTPTTRSSPSGKPHAPTVCNTMWALTDFTEANGATRVIPGSHLRDHDPDYGTPYDSVPAEMATGQRAHLARQPLARRRGEHHRRGPHRDRGQLLRRVHPPAGEPAARPRPRPGRHLPAPSAGAGGLRHLPGPDRPHRQADPRRRRPGRRAPTRCSGTAPEPGGRPGGGHRRRRGRLGRRPRRRRRPTGGDAPILRRGHRPRLPPGLGHQALHRHGHPRGRRGGSAGPRPTRRTPGRHRRAPPGPHIRARLRRLRAAHHARGADASTPTPASRCWPTRSPRPQASTSRPTPTEAVLEPLGLDRHRGDRLARRRLALDRRRRARPGRPGATTHVLAPETMDRATTVAFPGLAGVLPGIGRFDPLDWGLGFEIRDGKAPHWTGDRQQPPHGRSLRRQRRRSSGTIRTPTPAAWPSPTGPSTTGRYRSGPNCPISCSRTAPARPT